MDRVQGDREVARPAAATMAKAAGEGRAPAVEGARAARTAASAAAAAE